MPPYVPKLVGDPRFPRYVIRDRSRRPDNFFYTGGGWSQRLREALLFADTDEVNRTITRLYSDLLR